MLPGGFGQNNDCPEFVGNCLRTLPAKLEKGVLMEKKLLVGYARVDITPTEPVPLAGYGNSSARMSQSVLSPLYSTCIAITDGDGITVLMFHNDLCISPIEFCDPVRKAVSSATGVPYEHIMVTATHNHSSPDLNNRKEPTLLRYIQTTTEKMVKCAVEAMADRKPADMETAKVQTQNLCFVRHYVLSDGSYKGDNFGTLNKNPIVGHATRADGEMRIVKFIFEDSQDIWLVNFQGHPHRATGSKKYEVSADVVGVMRDKMEQDANCRFLYFSGASGNLNCGSRIPEENKNPDYIAHGNAMAEYALQASFHPVSGDRVQVVQQLRPEPINRADPQLLEHAREVSRLWVQTNDSKLVVPLAVSYGINSPYAANSILTRSAMKQDALTLPLYAVSIGDVAFVFAPYEMFDTQGKYIRDNAPFDTTVIATCANDHNSYIPSSYGFVYGCYEKDLCFFRPGTGECLAEEYLDMLNRLS